MMKVNITGVDEIRAHLKGIEIDIRRRILKRSMVQSLQVLQAYAENIAPVGTENRVVRKISHPGYVKRSFRVRSMPTGNPFLLEAQLQNTAYTALWVEYGHRIVKGRRRKKRVVGHARPRPFMRPTFETHAGTLPDILARIIRSQFGVGS
jgi:hypothetical protein